MKDIARAIESLARMMLSLISESAAPIIFPSLRLHDVGAREVIRRHEGEAVRIEVEALPDIDTDKDYWKFMAGGV